MLKRYGVMKNMKITEGMYVRTEYGIFKIIRITKDLGYNEREKRVLELDRNIPEKHYNFEFYKDESIFKNAKFSSNIIDLIKAGDYVNGSRVMHKISKGEDISFPYEHVEVEEDEDIDYERNVICYKNEDIKDVVTKEQFNSIKYEVGE